MEGRNRVIGEVRRKRNACAPHRAKSVGRTEVSAPDQGRNDLRPPPLEGWWWWWTSERL